MQTISEMFLLNLEKKTLSRQRKFDGMNITERDNPSSRVFITSFGARNIWPAYKWVLSSFVTICLSPEWEWNCMRNRTLCKKKLYLVVHYFWICNDFNKFMIYGFRLCGMVRNFLFHRKLCNILF